MRVRLNSCLKAKFIDSYIFAMSFAVFERKHHANII